MIAIRAFIGIDFDNECRKSIRELQQRFRRLAVNGRWKHSDNFHLTLKFLGEIDAQQQNAVDEALKSICAKYGPFMLETSEPGVFKDRALTGNGGIRVLWLGLGGDLPKLHSLSSDIDSSLAALGFAPEKRAYSPHITIGQDIRFECPFEQAREKVGYKKYGPIVVNKVTLFKSEQIQSKRVYTKISEYNLRS